LTSKKLRIERDNVLAEQRKSDPIQTRFWENRKTVFRLLHPIVLLPDLFHLRRQQPRNLSGINQEFDCSSLPGGPADESLFFQFQNHLMYRRIRRPKEPFQVRFRRWPAIHHCVIVNEGEVLSLLRCKSVCHRVCPCSDKTVPLQRPAKAKLSGPLCMRLLCHALLRGYFNFAWH
jgi:hypothetical protein